VNKQPLMTEQGQGLEMFWCIRKVSDGGRIALGTQLSVPDLMTTVTRPQWTHRIYDVHLFYSMLF
jgi:hypothetical protein